MLTLPPHAVLNFIFLKPVFNKRINFTNSFCVWLQACISYSRAIHMLLLDTSFIETVIDQTRTL